MHESDGWKKVANAPFRRDIQEGMINEADKINKMLASIDDFDLDTPDVNGDTPDLSNATPNIVDKNTSASVNEYTQVDDETRQKIDYLENHLGDLFN